MPRDRRKRKGGVTERWALSDSYYSQTAAGQQAEATLPRNYTILTQNVLKTFYYPPGNSTRGTQNRSGSR